MLNGIAARKPGTGTILTVGHSTHPIGRFTALLAGAGVDLVADVRRYPGSRRNPQFGAEPLAASLARAGIGYESFGEPLGGRREPRRRAESGDPPAGGPGDNSAWRNPSFRAYADHMASAEFAAGLRRLESLADGRRVAIMCAESDPGRCHRRLIADVLSARGRPVVHLLGDGRLVDHTLSPDAIVEGDRVHYPGQPRLEI